MRPKPTREWVMAELERLNVRVVSGRLIKEEDDGNGTDGAQSRSVKNRGNNNEATMGAGRRDSITSSLLNAAEMARGLGFDANAFFAQRRNSSLAMSLFDENRRESNATAAAVPMGNLDLDKETAGQNHRPLVGGGSAAAYEAARADYYRKMGEQNNKSSMDSLDPSQTNRPSLGGQFGLPNSSRRLSSLGFGNLFNFDTSVPYGVDTFNQANDSNVVANLGLSGNPNAHYEMLKLHHMNLLNEIQETTLMMNLYQQQQLQQQQQQRKLQQEQQLLTQQRLLSMGRNNSLGVGNVDSQNLVSPTGKQKPLDENEVRAELSEHEKELEKIKAEIEERKKVLAELENTSANSRKRSSENTTGVLMKSDNDNVDDASDDETPMKRVKL